MGVASSGTKAYFAGGHNGTSALTLVESYDVETGLWANTGYLSIARQAPAGVACGSKLLFGGGVSANFNTVYSTVDMYDITTGVWTVANLSVARMDIAAISYGNKVIFAGGCNYNIVCTNVVDIYDIATGTWSTANLSSARAGMAYAVSDDLAVFAGGFLSGGSVSDQVDIYNFTTNTWTTATLSEARVWASAAVVGDKVIIAGGLKYFPDVPSNKIDIFDASTGIWSTEVLFEPRAWISAGAVNGKAFFAGGSNIANGGVPYDFTNIVDVYNGADNSWSVDVLATPRTSQGVVAGNYFMVAGGTGQSGLLSSVEVLYVPYVPHIIHVPGDFSTIQDAIDAAGEGDTVLVADGTYYENINFLGKKPLLVTSEFIMDGDTNHINNTIIDGSQPEDPDFGSVVSMITGEDTTTVLCGFTITGGTGTLVAVAGNARLAGGVMFGSGGKLINNYIEYNNLSNEGWAGGGGIFAGGPLDTLPWVVLRENRITHNTVISSNNQGTGGGIEIWFNLVMEDNQLSYNEANGAFRGDGGGARISGNFGHIDLILRNNLITNNKAMSNSEITDLVISGGLDIFLDCSGTISNNIISFNEIEVADEKWGYGTGVLIEAIDDQEFTFENNLVNDNTYTGGFCMGGGLLIYDANGKYQNNVAQDNTGTHGGGVGIGGTSLDYLPVLINNTITGNEATYGGGIWAGVNANVINSIVWDNTATEGASIFVVGTLEVRYSDVQGDEVWPGEGNINEAPQFMSDGYHLDEPGGLLNAGISSINISGITYECPTYDIDGDLRPYSTTQPEMGVDEVQITAIGELVSTNNLPINIYPNPAGQMVTIFIKNGGIVKEVTIYDQVGQKVFRGIPDKNILDVSKLQPGVYLIRVITSQSEYREKLIIE